MNCHGCNIEIIKKSSNQKWCLRCSYDQCKPTSNKSLPNKKCPLCHNEFIPRNAQNVYCSKDCVDKFKKEKANSRWSTQKEKKPKLFFGYKELMVI